MKTEVLVVLPHCCDIFLMMEDVQKENFQLYEQIPEIVLSAQVESWIQ